MPKSFSLLTYNGAFLYQLGIVFLDGIGAGKNDSKPLAIG
jgi:hypothetical protein